MAHRVLLDSDREYAAEVIAQFAALIHSWLTNQFDEAADARRELEGLGVRVRLPRRPGRKADPHDK